jgi:hypothetical protein
MKMLRTIRLDPSDQNVFPRAAAPEEWAVTGTFAFVDADPATWSRKEQLAFRSGWLGTESFGRATFVQVADIATETYEAVVRRLAEHLHTQYGAPDTAAALAAAREEVDYAAGLADHEPGTLFAIEREFRDGGIAERIKVIDRGAKDGQHARIWTIVDDGLP